MSQVFGNVFYISGYCFLKILKVLNTEVFLSCSGIEFLSSYRADVDVAPPAYMEGIGIGVSSGGITWQGVSLEL